MLGIVKLSFQMLSRNVHHRNTWEGDLGGIHQLNAGHLWHLDVGYDNVLCSTNLAQHSKSINSVSLFQDLETFTLKNVRDVESNWRLIIYQKDCLPYFSPSPPSRRLGYAPARCASGSPAGTVK